MNEKLTAARPPLFSETHAVTIAAAARDYPEADGLSIDLHAERILIAASMTDGVIVKWVSESPMNGAEIDERRAQLAQAGLQYVSLTMHCDRLVPLRAGTTH